MTYRKNVSMSEEHKRMLDELEETGVLNQEFDGFSGMVQHFIERMHSNPEVIRKEVAEERRERLDRKIERLEEQIEEQELENRNSFDDKEIEEFFASLVDKVERKKGSRQHRGESFAEVYKKELEQGNIQAFTKKFYQIDKKTFREKFKEKAEELGHEISV